MFVALLCLALFSASAAERQSLKGNHGNIDATSPRGKAKKDEKGKSSKQQSLGDGSTLELTDAFYIVDETTECTVRYGDKSKTTKCMKIRTSTIPNHADGPYCQNGFWDHQMTQFPDDMSTSCLCQRYDCDLTCSDLCLACEPEEKQRTYLIPLEPRSRPDDGNQVEKCDSDNNYGDGLALNGVALAKNDPFEELGGQVRRTGCRRRLSGPYLGHYIGPYKAAFPRLAHLYPSSPLWCGRPLLTPHPMNHHSQNNIAPLDENGGHSTLQFTYHVRPTLHPPFPTGSRLSLTLLHVSPMICTLYIQYHAIPTIFFECTSGWDATNKVWATSAPDKQHSPLIGWGLDG